MWFYLHIYMYLLCVCVCVGGGGGTFLPFVSGLLALSPCLSSSFSPPFFFFFVFSLAATFKKKEKKREGFTLWCISFPIVVYSMVNIFIYITLDKWTHFFITWSCLIFQRTTITFFPSAFLELSVVCSIVFRELPGLIAQIYVKYSYPP